MAKEKISITVEINTGAAMREISRKQFGHRGTTHIPDKTKYSRHNKHRNKRNDDSGVFYC